MIVEELILLLRGFDPNMTVKIELTSDDPSFEGSELLNIGAVDTGNDVDGTTGIVCIAV